MGVVEESSLVVDVDDLLGHFWQLGLFDVNSAVLMQNMHVQYREEFRSVSLLSSICSLQGIIGLFILFALFSQQFVFFLKVS